MILAKLAVLAFCVVMEAVAFLVTLALAVRWLPTIGDDSLGNAFLKCSLIVFGYWIAGIFNGIGKAVNQHKEEKRK